LPVLCPSSSLFFNSRKSYSYSNYQLTITSGLAESERVEKKKKKKKGKKVLVEDWMVVCLMCSLMEK